VSGNSRMSNAAARSGAGFDPSKAPAITRRTVPSFAGPHAGGQEHQGNNAACIVVGGRAAPLGLISAK
jgi:hypothetical protein